MIDEARPEELATPGPGTYERRDLQMPRGRPPGCRVPDIHMYALKTHVYVYVYIHI